jgi:hypothetical protein
MEEKSCATPPVVGPPSIEKFFSSPLTQSILIYPRGRQWGPDGNSPRVNTIARTGSQAPRLASKAADARPRIGPRSSNVCPLVNQARAPRNITRRPERLINQALEPAINQHRGKSPPPAPTSSTLLQPFKGSASRGPSSLPRRQDFSAHGLRRLVFLLGLRPTGPRASESTICLSLSLSTQAVLDDWLSCRCNWLLKRIG